MTNPSEVRIRDYVADDYDRIVDLIYLPFEARGISREEFLQELRGQSSRVFGFGGDRIRVLESVDATIIGCYRYSRWPREAVLTTQAHLFDISVHPESQGKGLGGALMTDLLTELKREGYSGVYSHISKSNTRSVGLHLKHGFAQLRDDGDDVLWERAL